MKAPGKKNRSRRLRKKLHVGEFKELGFGFYTFGPIEDATVEEDNALCDRFIQQLIVPRGLSLSGSVDSGYVTTAKAGSATNEDRTALRNWLLMQPEIDSVCITKLQDVWYPPTL